MSKAEIKIEGFVARDPELKYHDGRAFTNVTVPHTPRRKNRQTGDWEDAGPTLWVQASFWEQQAEAVVSAVRKGTLATITGQPELNVFSKQDGTTDAQLRIKFGTLAVIPRPQAPQQAVPAASAPEWGGSAWGSQNAQHAPAQAAEQWSAQPIPRTDETPF